MEGVVVLTKPLTSGEDICIRCAGTNECLCWHLCCQEDLNTHLLDDHMTDTPINCQWAVSDID